MELKKDSIKLNALREVSSLIKSVNQIVPYNDIWLDCVTNNLLSILISRDESFRILPLAMEVSYTKTLTDQHYDSEEDRIKVLTGGNLFPTVQYSNTTVKNHFDLQYRNYLDYKEMIEGLKSSMADGSCTFLMIDRYFYPTGRESGKMHMIHPVFILGYDDDMKVFHTIEDCITLGVLNYFDLPYEAVERSCQHFLDQGKPLIVIVYKPLDSSLHNIIQNTRDAANNMITNFFDETTSYLEEYNLYYHSGLNALRKFHEEMEHLFTNLNDMSPSFAALYLLRFPQLHARNQQLVRFLNENGYIQDSDCSALVKNYKLLQSHWINYKNRSMYFFERRGSNADTKSELFLNLFNRMHEIIDLELITAHKFKISIT